MSLQRVISPEKVSAADITDSQTLLTYTKDEAALMYSLKSFENLWPIEQESTIDQFFKLHQNALVALLEFLDIYGIDMIEGTVELIRTRKATLKDLGTEYAQVCRQYARTWESALRTSSLAIRVHLMNMLCDSLNAWYLDVRVALVKLRMMIHGPEQTVAGVRGVFHLNPRAAEFVPGRAQHLIM